MSVAKTQGVRVEVTSAFVPEHSNPERNQFVFSYTARIRNEGSASVQLVSRHWVITDGRGRVHEVRGAGVVGQQPMLEPGEEFEYTSACPLPTPYGTMHGTYEMLTDGGERFDAEIAPFELATSSDARRLWLN